MKNDKSKDRRVINIPKIHHDILKNYCDKNALDMPKWMVKNSLEKIHPKEMFEFILSESLYCLCPSDRKSLTLVKKKLSDYSSQMLFEENAKEFLEKSETDINNLLKELKNLGEIRDGNIKLEGFDDGVYGQMTIELNKFKTPVILDFNICPK
jgi:poly(3-hydroxyalkanoate) synthetase